METIKKIWFEEERIFMETDSDIVFSRPLEAFPVLKSASKEDQNNFEIGQDKMDVRWSLLDEDIHINSFFEEKEPNFSNSIAETLKQFPQLNISALAVQIGINKSLLAKYIYGIKNPSKERKQQIERELHALGERLLAVKVS